MHALILTRAVKTSTLVLVYQNKSAFHADEWFCLAPLCLLQLEDYNVFAGQDEIKVSFIFNVHFNQNIKQDFTISQKCVLERKKRSIKLIMRSLKIITLTLTIERINNIQFIN